MYEKKLWLQTEQFLTTHESEKGTKRFKFAKIHKSCDIIYSSILHAPHQAVPFSPFTVLLTSSAWPALSRAS